MKRLAITSLLVNAVISVWGLAVTSGAAPATSVALSSPDGRMSISMRRDSVEAGVGELRYNVTFDGRPVIDDSRAGLDLDQRVWEMALNIANRKLVQPQCWMDNFVVDSVCVFETVDTTWTPLYGERSKVRDHYNSATMYMSKHDASKYRMNVELRAYDEGVAFRYYFPEHPAAVFHKVVDDLTDYTVPDGVMAWSEQWAQAPFDRTPVDSIHNPVERALTLEYPGGYWSALLDADVDDWCLTKYVAREDKPGTLTSVMYSPVDLVTYYATPWKIIMAADTPGQLIENNDIVLNLNPRCEIADTDWIKPGKIMRETTLTMEGARRTIDFCRDHNMQYMLFDWKWYEPCTSHDGDATKVIDRLDMDSVVAYGRERGVGVWLYVNQHALMKQQRELFPLLAQWGIVGVKSGFVQYASHRWATWLHDMVRYAAENKLLMNIHDEYRPSGFSRTYPNLLTQEGIHGNEEWPDARHDTTLPFTRMINGAADYTICYYDSRLKNTHGHQLAASLVFYSPLLTLYWYDTPSRSHGEPEMEWFDNLVTTWDETRVLSGYPGQEVTMARRNGDNWWVGALNGNEERDHSVELSFLDPDRQYVARIYNDDEKVATATRVRCDRYIVKKGDILNFRLQGRGGAAVHLVPATAADLKSYKKYKSSKL